MNNWSDGKKFLFDHIFDSVLYGAMLFVGAFLDPLLNLLHSCGFNVVPHEVAGHDYSLGKFQIVLIVLGAFKIVRLFQKLREWEYYK